MLGDSVRFAILGPFELSGASGAIVLDQAKPRALLAMLVVSANTAVPSGRLIDDLWEHDPPRSAGNTLQTYVHKLRSVLPPNRVVTRDGGYVLVTDPASVDAFRFEQLVNSPSARLPNPRLRAETLRRALALWRGEALSDFSGAGWAHADVARLEESRLHTLERCIEAELAVGRQRDVLGELEQLIRQYPFRERFSALQMLALYRAGRQADALRAYERLRRTLADELGIEPSRELIALERDILLHDPHLDAPLRTGTISVPASRRALAASTAAFVGRASELEMLEGCFGDVIAGEQVTVLIGGEPGIGKTALSATFAHTAATRGALTLYGHCDADLEIPFQPWNEALAHLITHVPSELLDAHIAVHGGVLAHLVPELVERVAVPSGADIEPRRHLLFAAVADLLTRVSAVTPVVILLDDLHWADRSTIELLQFLVGRDGALRALIVATFRDSEIGPDHVVGNALAAFVREPAVHHLMLGGLNRADVLALLELAVGERLRDGGIALRDALMRETDGNPFFVIEIVRHLTDIGAIARDDASRGTNEVSLRDRGLPVGVRHVIANRVARLGADAGSILGVASVMGLTFDLEILGRVVGIDDEMLVRVCERGVAAAVLEHTDAPGRYAFAHGLIQHTLYEDLGATVRQRLHRRTGQVFEDRYGDADANVPELAYHWLAASPADIRRALHYATRAGDLALAALAPSDAARWYGQALELLAREPVTDDATRCSLLVGLGRARTMAGDGEARAILLDAGRIAQQIGAPDLLIAAAVAATRGDFNQAAAEDVELARLTHAALDVAGGADTADRVRLLAALMEHTGGGDWELARERATAAVDAARRLDDDRLLMEAISATYVARAQPDSLPRRLTDTEHALVIADALGDPLERLNTRFTRYVAVMEAADIGAADHLQAEMERIAESIDLTLPHARFRILMMRAGRRMLAGDHEGAGKAANELLALASAANLPDAGTAAGGLLGLIGYERGHVGEMIDATASAVEHHPDFAVLRAAVAFYYSELDRHDDARVILEVESDTGFRSIPYDINWTTGMALYADCAAALNDHVAATILRDRLSPFAAAHTYNGLTSSGALSRVLGRLDALLGDRDRADLHFRNALELNTRLGAPFWITRTQIDYGGLLADGPRSDVGAATELLRAASATASRYGYDGLRSRAELRLAQLATG